MTLEGGVSFLGYVSPKRLPVLYSIVTHLCTYSYQKAVDSKKSTRSWEGKMEGNGEELEAKEWGWIGSKHICIYEIMK